MAALAPTNPTAQFGQELTACLHVLFLDSTSTFATLPANVALAITYTLSKVNDGMYTIALANVQRGDALPEKIGHRLVDMRVEADGRIALGYYLLARSDSEIGPRPLQYNTTKYYGEGAWTTWDVASEIARFLTSQT